jgi:hypothetical protein
LALLVLSARPRRRGARTTRLSPRIGTVGSAIATCCAIGLRQWCKRCIAEGLVTGAALAFDASLIAADANKQRAVADEVDWEGIARTRRSVREYLNTLDEAAWGAASETVSKLIAKSDPAAQWTGAHKGHAFFAYANEGRDYPRRRAGASAALIRFSSKRSKSLTDKQRHKMDSVSHW